MSNFVTNNNVSSLINISDTSKTSDVNGSNEAVNKEIVADEVPENSNRSIAETKQMDDALSHLSSSFENRNYQEVFKIGPDNSPPPGAETTAAQQDENVENKREISMEWFEYGITSNSDGSTTGSLHYKYDFSDVIRRKPHSNAIESVGKRSEKDSQESKESQQKENEKIFQKKQDEKHRLNLKEILTTKQNKV